MSEINKFTTIIDMLTNELNNLDKDASEFPLRKGKLAYKFLRTFGTERGRGNFIEFSVILNLKNRLSSDTNASIDKIELNEEIKILTNKCRRFMNMLVDRERWA